MKGPHFERPDAKRVSLRALVVTVNREIARLPRSATSEGNGSTNELRASWAELVKLLALGPAPDVRECPVCKHIGMRAATRCGYCWTELSPLTSPANGELGSTRRGVISSEPYDGFYD